MKGAESIYKIGSYLYSRLLWLDRRLRGKGLKFSIAKFCKTKVKKAFAYILDFEKEAVKLAKQHDCQAIVLGHIHSPKIANIDDIDYLNCGDWVENNTGIVEHFDGRFELIT